MAEEPQPPGGMNDETIVGKPLPPEPERIGNFTVLGKLGQGGMGAVYKAHDPAIDRDVALKLLPPHLTTDADFVARFKREAAAAGKFVHSNIVQVYAAGEDAGTHFIAMEFVEGVSLQKHIANTGQLDCADALVVAIEAAKGLQYAWNKAHLVHRDIKPDNILISHDGDVKVADLGLAKTLQGGSTNFTQTGTVMGSPHYISPEQGRGDKDVDFRSDIYSLGCTLYHMLTGRPPFEGDNIGTLIYKHIHESPPGIATLRPDCPANVAALVKKMMAKDRAKRPATYDELIAELTAAHGALGKSETVGAAAKKRKLLTLAGTGVAVVAVVAGVLMWQPWKSSAGRTVSSVPPPSQSNAIAKPVDDAFIRKVAALPAEEQVKRVVAKLKELNPGYDGEVKFQILSDKVVELSFSTVDIADISPVRALLWLQKLHCMGDMSPHRKNVRYGLLVDLSPLKGMRLSDLHCSYNPISDLTPLSGMPLEYLAFADSKVSDLSALKGMKLVTLAFDKTRVQDLSPIAGMPLGMLSLRGTRVSDLSPLQGMLLWTLNCDAKVANEARNRVLLQSIKTLNKMNDLPVAEFWKQVDAGKVPGASAETTASVQPVDDAFIKEVAALPAEEQVKLVMAKMKDLNPGFDGAVKHRIENGKVAELNFGSLEGNKLTRTITNVSPIRAFASLKKLSFAGGAVLEDLSPLVGLQLEDLNMWSNSKFSDLRPLQGMPLRSMNCEFSAITNLSPLKGMPLVHLDLAYSSKLTDLSPLQGMTLKLLRVERTGVKDLSPLKGMPLEHLKCYNTKVTDLSPLLGMPLKELACDFVPERDTEVLRSIKTLKTINDVSVKVFWLQVAAGDIPKPK